MKLLFVCLGNICRSPSAEAVMTALVEREGLSDQIQCDSAGTIGYHAGNPADARMQSHAVKRGYDLTSRSRQFDPSIDFDKFDMVIGMDDQNVSDIKTMDSYDSYGDKIYIMTQFCSEHSETEVPDPYYGGEAGFELVLDLLEDACRGLLDNVKCSILNV